jgi:hypothetical protein
MSDAPKEYPVDFIVPKHLRAEVDSFDGYVTEVCWAFANRLHDAGVEPAYALCVVTNILIREAAHQAVVTRKCLLNGEPDPGRWRYVTDAAFRKVLEAAA